MWRLPLLFWNPLNIRYLNMRYLKIWDIQMFRTRIQSVQLGKCLGFIVRCSSDFNELWDQNIRTIIPRTRLKQLDIMILILIPNLWRYNFWSQDQFETTILFQLRHRQILSKYKSLICVYMLSWYVVFHQVIGRPGPVYRLHFWKWDWGQW